MSNSEGSNEESPASLGGLSQGLLAHALDCLEEIVVVCDSAGFVRYVNRAFHANSEYSAAEVLGKTPFFMLPSSGSRREIIRSITGLRLNDVMEFRLTIRSKQGSFVESSMMVSAHTMEEGGEIHYICIVRDLSREQQLRQQVHQSQRMETIGTLSREIVHKFNNILGSIAGQVELWEVGSEANEFAKQRSQRIHQSIEKGKELIAQIRSFTTRSIVSGNSTDLVQVMKQVTRFAENVLPSGVELRKEIPETACFVMGDSEELQQMLMNLITNAIEALNADGGQLELRLKIVDQVIQRYSAGTSVIPERCACITVSDNGSGVDPSYEDKIFEPFFTTKTSRGAAGMGLAVVKSIVERYKGSLSYYSAPEQGAVFEIFLPVHTPELPESLESLGPRGSGERVLLADEERYVTQSGSSLLSGLGYKVRVCNSGEEVLKLLRTSQLEFDIIIVDLDFSDMTGLEVMKTIRSEGCTVPAIATSTLGTMPEPWETDEVGICRVLNKPCPARELATAVKDALSGERLI